MTAEDTHSFVTACSALAGNIAANETLADAIVTSLRLGKLTSKSGPIAISNVLGGVPGNHHLKTFLKTWATHMRHLNALDVASMLESSLATYRIAQGRAHMVDTVWTGPEVSGSEVRRTEGVVIEMLSNAKSEVLIVGYWLVSSTDKIKELIELLIKKARTGVRVRFVLDPGEKSNGADNFSALNKRWPLKLDGARREVYSWSESINQAVSKDDSHYDRKLHAKVIVVDRHDALVTSANLTQAGLLENLEMGLRIIGPKAKAVVRHFDLLIEEGILEEREKR